MRFGLPEFEVDIAADRIKTIRVTRGAPCGATWEAAARVEGLKVDEALVRIGLETQFFCSANPAGWDPLHGRSPVHLAGKIHSSALRKAVARFYH